MSTREPERYVDTLDGCGHPAHDDRLMHDGRPAYAWDHELKRLREENAAFKAGTEYESAKRLLEVLGVMQWVIEQHPDDMAQHVHIRLSDRALARAYSWREALEEAEMIPVPATEPSR